MLNKIATTLITKKNKTFDDDTIYNPP